MKSRKKRILIVNNNLVTGGVQRSLVNLMNQIKDKYDITLFLFSYSGDYVPCIPATVKVLEASPLLKMLGLSQAQTKQMGLFCYLMRAILVIFTKIFSNHFPIAFLVSTQEKLFGFDAAISFLHNDNEKSFYGGCNEFVLKRVEARQKITFSHCDFLHYGGNTPKNRAVYRQFDSIAAVSEGCRDSFIKAVPELASRTHCVYNCHEYGEYLHKASLDPLEYRSDCLNIVTVARLTPEKGIIRGIHVISRLVNEGYPIRWHIVGNGSQRSEIEDKIQKSKMAEHIVLHGNQENPYRYMKNADLFLLPSFHEAAPMVFHEAKCLGVPIITTDTISAHEMVKDSLEGIVCGNNEEQLYDGIKRALEEPFFIEKCKEFLRKQEFTNESAVDQFSRMISDEESLICQKLRNTI